MTNRLAQEKSPYLLQHAHNPVDWYPWGEAAFEKARREDKPIFLSVGYSTCHWCHVMERESFENETIAAFLNEHFVSIKVDREERPDVDRLYMTYVQAVSGSGGWPMTVFLTPNLMPFYGGTYFPPNGGYGRPGFGNLLAGLHNAWNTDRQSILETSSSAVGGLRRYADLESPGGQEDESWEAIFQTCYSQLAESYDEEWAGFGSAPKFPRPVVHDFLHAYTLQSKNEGARVMSEWTLRMMADRGMHDQLAGGFHRYSVDRYWVVSHFEKMLYDQAQLVISYLEMYGLTGDRYFAATAEKTLAYVLHDMTHPSGAFYAAEDADSYANEGDEHKEEGAFYVWTKSEVDEILRQDSPLFCSFYGVTTAGNAPAEGDPHGEFNGKNILFENKLLDDVAASYDRTPRQARAVIADCRLKLLEIRAERPRPHRDEKLIASWNGLMISAFARAAAVLGVHRHATAAARAGEFIWNELWDGQELKRHWKDGPAPVSGFADDYAALARGFLDLYAATFDVVWVERAERLLDTLHANFWDEARGGYYNSAPDPHVLIRFKEDYDGAEPSANSLAALAWVRLHHLTGREDALENARRTTEAFAGRAAIIPSSMPLLLRARLEIETPPAHVVICGARDSEDTQAMIQATNERFAPFSTVMLLDTEAQDYFAERQPFLAAMSPLEGQATAYVCQNFACQQPITDAEALRSALGNRREE